MSARRWTSPRLWFDRRAMDALLGHATSPIERRIVLLASVLALLLVGGYAWHVGSRLQAARDRNADLIQALSRSAQPSVKPVVHMPAQPSLTGPSDLRDETLARQMLNLPWSDILDGLERHASPDVGLTLLEPDGAASRLNVQAEAPNVDLLLTYAQRLSVDPSFGRLALRQQSTNETDPNRPVRLSFTVSISARLRPVDAP